MLDGHSKLPPLFGGGPFLRVSFHKINHPVYGEATFSGDIPLLLPFRGSTRKEILPAVEEADQVAAGMMDFGRVLWADEEDDVILTRLQDLCFLCAVMGGIGPLEPRFGIWVKAIALVIAIDDQLDSLDNVGVLAEVFKETAEMCRTTETMFDRHIPCATTALAAMMTEVDALNAQLHTIPQFREKFSQGLRHEFYLFAASHVAELELKAMDNHAILSLSSAHELQRNIAGWYSGIEMLLILQDLELPDSLRQDITFSVIRSTVLDIGLYTNSLFGLLRDLRLCQEDSSIMDDVVSGRATLQMAIKRTHTELVHAIHDCKIATDLLLQAHEGDEIVAKYVHIVLWFVDGILYGYTFWRRYGSTGNMKIFEK